MARRNAASDHRPIPVSASGVIFEEKIVPNGVGTGRPPAKLLPPRTVWQSLQFPIAVSSRPRLMRSASKDCRPGGSIAAIAGRQTTAKTVAAPAIRMPAMTLATIRGDLFIRPACSCSHRTNQNLPLSLHRKNGNHSLLTTGFWRHVEFSPITKGAHRQRARLYESVRHRCPPTLLWLGVHPKGRA